ncbi:hypothetical protein ACFYZJ_01340 [Streptomyces sp. NPDC001848]|uniref:hypothetical protein n=1 Tax=Streptomyces sp. NPDC001848 TaxID=3364618 RepID=UPI00367818A5
MQLADTTYRISYKGGDGNDVVLTAVGGTPSVKALTDPSSGTTDHTRTEDATGNGSLSWWPGYALGVAMVAGLMVPAILRERNRTARASARQGGRHAAR